MKEEYLEVINKSIGEVVACISIRPQEKEQEIIGYLKSAKEKDMFYGPFYDLVENNGNKHDHMVDITLTTYTDGKWCWDNSLIYHIERYHYRISDDFLAHMQKNNFQVPKKFRRKG